MRELLRALSHTLYLGFRVFGVYFFFCFYQKFWGDFVGFSWLRGTLTILCFMRLYLCVNPSFRTDLTTFSELRWTSTDGECRSVRLNAFEVLEEEYTSRRFCLFFLPLLLFQYFTLCNIWKGRGDERRTWCPVFDIWTFGTAFLKVSIVFFPDCFMAGLNLRPNDLEHLLPIAVSESSSYENLNDDIAFANVLCFYQSL